MEITIFLGFVAGLFHVAAFYLYHRQTLRGQSKPNIATWSLWSVLSTINAATYFVLTDDWQKAILPIMSTTALLVVFTKALFGRRFTPLSNLEKTAFALGMIGVMVWYVLKSAVFANLILQACIFVSFVPTYRNVWRNPGSERPAPWLMWSFAYILTIIVVILRWQGHYLDLVYPVHLLILYLGIGLWAMR